MPYILDTETTGLTGADQVIELAWIKPPGAIRLWVEDYVTALLGQNITQLNFLVPSKEKYNEQFNPTVPIHKHAYAVHGISKLKLLKCRPSTEVAIPEDMTYMIGHNINFDHRMLGKPDVLLIDTMKLSKLAKKLGFINPEEVANDKLDTLITYYYPEYPISEKHSAMNDVYKVTLFLAKVLEWFPSVTTWEELHKLQVTETKK